MQLPPVQNDIPKVHKQNKCNIVEQLQTPS